MSAVKKCALYIRAADYGPGPQLQIDALQVFAEKMGFTIAEVFEDFASDVTRPGYSNALSSARDAAFEILIVWKLDRLDLIAGSVDKTFRLIADLSASGVRFISIKDQIDSSGTGSELVMAVLKACERSRNEIKGERIHKSLSDSRTLGDPVGRPRKRNDEKILELSSKGLTIRKIAEDLGISTWSVHSAIKKARLDLD